MTQNRLVLLFAVIGLGGCGAGDVPRAIVEGQVTFNDEIVQQGFITFIPILGVTGSPVQLNIKEGHYSSRTDLVDKRGVVVGENDVQILGMHGTGKKVRAPDGTMIDEVVQIIPRQFNEETTLRHDIKRGRNDLDFHLKSP